MLHHIQDSLQHHHADISALAAARPPYYHMLHPDGIQDSSSPLSVSLLQLAIAAFNVLTCFATGVTSQVG
jgi:hypothetical protein